MKPLAGSPTTSRRLALGWLMIGLALLPGIARGATPCAVSSGGRASDPGSAPAALAASVSETADAVRLCIQASGDIEPGSVEVRFAGRKAIVLARDAEGRAIRSQSVRLPAAVVEEGASADYDTDGALLVTLRKQATARDASPRGDPQAAAR